MAINYKAINDKGTLRKVGNKNTGKCFWRQEEPLNLNANGLHNKLKISLVSKRLQLKVTKGKSIPREIQMFL